MVTITNPFNSAKLDDWKFWKSLSGALGWGSAGTSTGGRISTDQAMRLASVASCVFLLSDCESVLPLCLYKDKGDGKKDIIRDDEWGYSDLIKYCPTPGLNGMEFRGKMAAERLTRGNSLYKINRVGRSKVVELMTYESGAIDVREKNTKRRNGLRVGPLEPEYTVCGEVAPRDEILHFRGPVLEGYRGVSPITYAASSIEYMRELEKFGTRMQKNGGKPGGAVELGPGKISDEAFERVKKTFNESFSGDGTGKIAIMAHGSKYHSVAVSPADAEFLENRKFQRSEIAGIFRVPPHMIGDLDKATFSNIEHQAIQFVTYSLMPWLMRTEGTLNSMLLTKRQRRAGYYFKHNVTALLRGDSKARADFYKVMAMHMTTNEIRALEEMNPLDDGDERIIPMNMLNGEGETNEPKPEKI